MAKKSTDATDGDPPVTKRRPRKPTEPEVTVPDPLPSLPADPVEAQTPAPPEVEPDTGIECFHGGTAPGLRTVQVQSASGDWFPGAFADLAEGSVFRLFEPDGAPAGDGRTWVASGPPYRPNAAEERLAVDCRAYVATAAGDSGGPLQVGEAVWLRTGSGMLTVKSIVPWTFDEAGKESETGALRHVIVINPDGTDREYPEAALTRTPTPVAEVQEPVLEEEDPVEAALARARPTLPEDVANAMRALWAGDRMIEAIALYRRSVQPEPTLAEAKLATEYVVGEGAAPEGFDLAAFLSAGAEVEPTPEARAEVIQLFEAEPPKARTRPALKVAPKPPPRTGKEIIGRRTTEVEFDLTDDELREHGQRMAHLHMEMVAEEARQAGVKKEMRERLAGLKGEIAREAGIVEKKKEVRSIPVYLEADFSDGVVREVILDGGVPVRVVCERPITPDERQLPLFPVGSDAPPAAEPANAEQPSAEPANGVPDDDGDHDPGEDGLGPIRVVDEEDEDRDGDEDLD